MLHVTYVVLKHGNADSNLVVPQLVSYLGKLEDAGHVLIGRGHSHGLLVCPVRGRKRQTGLVDRRHS